MRPERLNPLFAGADSLKGVGAKLEKPLERLGLTRVRDFAYHLPERFIERRQVPDLASAGIGEHIIVRVTVRQHRSSGSGRGPFRVIAEDGAGAQVALTYFGRASYSAKSQLPVGEARWIAGRLDEYGDEWQIVHPDHVWEDGGEALGTTCEPVYALADGLTQGRLRPLVEQALAILPELAEWIDPGMLARRDWPGWRDALHLAHRGPDRRARDRLAYDELFASALALMLVRADNRRRRGPPLQGDGRLRDRLSLPFALTGAQARALREIEGDMAQPHPMLRLLQGDVGSGKTVVALLAMLNAIECGKQAAMLAPTEILARQHHASLMEMARGTGVEIALLTGRGSQRGGGRARESILMGLLDGSIDIVVGTHAIFQESVGYKDLALVVIDEQHRFGVGQRLMLQQKAKGTAHCLAMTATPIPRTLLLAQHGEMEVSQLDELPPGRKPIDTRVVAVERMDDVVAGLIRHVAAGRQAFWVCPMVHENEREDLAAAEERFDALKKALGPDNVTLVHGQLRTEIKDANMARFASGEVAVLVATTVIEVGVNVPNASLMVIEQAERFGLAQLHQLRGRVGRGAAESVCMLLRGQALSETGRERLALMRETQDGFRLAEEDLRLRGGGEILGTRQSGEAAFRIATPEQIAELLEPAHDDAKLLMAQAGMGAGDAGENAATALDGPRGEAARGLLYLFERDYGVQLLRGG